MTTTSKPLAYAVACALGACVLVPLPVSALMMITTTAVGFSGSANVTDVEGGGGTTNNGASLGTSSISQFDQNLGVLIGTTLNLTSTRTQTTQVSSTDGEDHGTDKDVTSEGSGNSTADISAPGVSFDFADPISQTSSCTGGRLGGCTGISSTSAPTNTDLAASVSPDGLDDYVGAGTFAVIRTAPTLTAEQNKHKFTGDESTKSTVTWSGSVSATYDYLLHAAPSFYDSTKQLTLDFGTVSQNAVVSPLGFSIFNAVGERVGLDFDSILTVGGDTDELTTNLGDYIGLDLAAGVSKTFLANFDTSIARTFDVSYTLGFSDDDVGAESSRGSYSLTLHLTGVVSSIQPLTQVLTPDTIPEPASLALLGLGIAGIGLQRRKKET